MMGMGSEPADKSDACVFVYVGALWAMFLIPFWVALARKSTQAEIDGTGPGFPELTPMP